MKPNFDIRIKLFGKRFWMNCGWYSGEEFKLLNLSILEILTDAKNKVDQINFFNIQITKFILTCGISLW